MIEKYPGGDPSALGGNVLKIDFPTLGEFGLGKGTIGPENRNDIDQELLSEMLEAIANGEFNIPVEDLIPVICVDGRLDENGNRIIAPSGAGATNGIAYARVLSNSGELNDKSELEVIEGTVSILKSKGHRVSTHGDDHGTCGCGACNHCKKIFIHIAEDFDNISTAANALGVEINADEEQTIKNNAKNKADSDFFVEDRSKTLTTAENAGAINEKLVDQHNELAVVINTVPGTTIDRVAIRKRFGVQYDVFVVDGWPFEEAAKEINFTGYEAETDRIVKAMNVYNIATASTLAHSSIPVVPVKLVA